MDKISQTRTTFNKLIGQIIEETLGIDGVRKLFEAAENGDVEAQAKIDKVNGTGKAPSGFLAVDLGFVDIETKEALLTGQSAIRTLLAIEDMEKFYDVDIPQIKKIISQEQTSVEGFKTNFYSPFKNEVEKYYAENVVPADTENRAFQFIGLKDESEMLVHAQATQQLFAEYLRNEQLGQKDFLLNNPLKIGQMKPLGRGYLDGFKASVVQSLLTVSEKLVEKGYEDVGADLMNVSKSIEFNQKNSIKHTPKGFAETAEWLQHRLAQKDNNEYIDPSVQRYRKVEVDSKWESTMTKRARQSLGLVA